MKHGAQKNRKNFITIWVLLVVISITAGSYLVGNANSKKNHNNIDSSSTVTNMSTLKSERSADNSSSSQQSQSIQTSASQDIQNSNDQDKQVSRQTNNKNDSFNQQTIDSLLSKRTKTPIQDLPYYSGQKKVILPMTDGTIDPQGAENGPALYTDGITFWSTQLTINGKKEKVVAAYERQGYFEVYTKEPTNTLQGFTYNGEDYDSHIGDKDLDALANSNKTVHY